MATPISGKLRLFAVTLLKVVSCYVAVAIALMAILEIYDSPFVRMQSKRLAWWVSPYNTFPFPLEPNDLESNSFLDRRARILLSNLALLTSVVGSVHLITFSITAILHRRRSVPNYWRDLDPPPDATRMLLRSAQLGSWAILLASISQVIQQFEIDCLIYSASLPYTGNMGFIAAFSASVLVLMAASSRAVKRVVLERLDSSERRCLGCEHALRVTTANRCPECGRPFDPHSKIDYRLKWGPVSFLMTRRWPVIVLVCLVMLITPPGVAWLVGQMPRHVQNRVTKYVIGPLGWRPRGSLSSFPIRLDSVCVFQNKSEIAVVRFDYVRPRYARYRAHFWSDSTRLGRTPPDQDITGELDAPNHDALRIGPWNFSAQSGGSRMVWLYCRTAGLEVKSFLIEDVPQEYRGVLDLMIGKKPTSANQTPPPHDRGP